MVTIYDIAKKANCSAMTVSRVINNTGRVSEATRRRILRIMKEMNYVPNTMARSLVLQETRILSLIITDITNPFYTSLARGAEDAALQLGYKLLLANSDENVEKEKEYIETMLSTRVDGVLFAPSSDASLTNLQRFTHQGIPLVLLDREVPGIECDTVLGDNVGGARALTEHLIELGHRRIAFINGSSSVSTARLRMQGYREALERHHIPYDTAIVAEADYKKTDVSRVMERLLGHVDRPTALFAANNFLALSAIRYCQTKGIRVPEDISVCCFDELEANFVVNPFMTVIAQPAYEFGYTGIQLLVNRIQQKTSQQPPNKIMLPWTIHIRNSTRPLSTNKD